MRWRARWQEWIQTLGNPLFWWTLLGVSGVLLVWAAIYYLAIKYIDPGMALRSTFCSNDDERNNHLLVIILLTPLFIVGVIGIISEWLTVMENRAKHRKSSLKPLLAFSLLLQVSGALILVALQC